MKNSKLARQFAEAIARRNETGAATPLDARVKKGFAATSKKKFLKELDKRLQLFAAEMPHAVTRTGIEDLVPLPAKIHFNKGALSVWRGRRPSFQVGYAELRKLDGMKQILKMAKAADVGISIAMSDLSSAKPNRDLDQCNEPTPKEKMPWTMKRDTGTFGELYITVKPEEKFDAAKFPKKLAPKP